MCALLFSLPSYYFGAILAKEREQVKYKSILAGERRKT
jgi:hypothetical protein